MKISGMIIIIFFFLQCEAATKAKSWSVYQTSDREQMNEFLKHRLFQLPGT